ncbi:glutamyl-tRNA reductase [Microbacterium sp. zg.Y1090]|uniref:glutamyl-tRNA reductase n=1 Tax=Microbacterium TaxID=33882 RepID=UPI00214ABA73|nr:MULTISPECIES: glutamyl-tRNA reductase [unclassified Microbacterium]MCR2813248.1 glutamyl-tRNA reductase [Microbacterium sp. zg.Y1084]MCR2819561.1 glutamyl-tRNA reductase [Microbacterium sp. zg.Y1090]MDL5487415.1 glutamyl-tRNA reductase [Microbacterium sp. zg-Y1211]WIM28528.1 glutamyl-tRNA reductase [Microbacterium sp. zg-Y1090]
MLLCVSASHKTAPFELLERLSVHTDRVAPMIASYDASVQGAVVVATCNRFEAYVEMDEPAADAGIVGVEAALTAIEAATGVAPAELEGAYVVATGDDVARHLFSVASGLESVVVGEGEIAGQVRRALTEAREQRTTSPELERLFQKASETQRGIKNATAIGRAGRSLVRLSLELAGSRVTDWSRLRVLMVGTGSYAAATVAALRDRGAADIAVASPSGRETVFAARHALRPVPAASFTVEVATADLVITCTSAEHPVLSAETFAAGVAAADPALVPARRLVIDLGLPRNVDHDVAEVEGTDLLDLETIRLHAPLEELQATDDARRLVDDAAQRFVMTGERRSVAPAVVALRAHVATVLETEIARARGRGDDGTTEQALRHLAGVLMHTPTVRAHELAEQGRSDDVFAAVTALFGLEVTEPVTLAAPGEIATAG